MAHINLLPWRERQREERKREFISIIAGVVVIAGGLLFLVDRYFIGEINTQTARNEFVRAEIQVLDEEVTEINQLRQQKEDIRSRMTVINDLQGSRPVIVRIFDEMVKTMPQGVYYESVARTGDSIAIEGIAESYSSFTALLRRLEDSEWFKDIDPSDLSATDTGDDPLAESYSFSLTLALELPDQEEEV